MELQEQAQQAQASTSPADIPSSRNKVSNFRKLPSLIDEKDELDSYLLRFEPYAENASWENTWVIKLSALLTGRAMDIIIPGCQNIAANDYDKLKKALLTRYN